jgi:hypothetical protein
MGFVAVTPLPSSARSHRPRGAQAEDDVAVSDLDVVETKGASGKQMGEKMEQPLLSSSPMAGRAAKAANNDRNQWPGWLVIFARSVSEGNFSLAYASGIYGPFPMLKAGIP